VQLIAAPESDRKQRTDEFVAKLRRADEQFALTCRKIANLIAGRFPTDDLLRTCRRLWITDIPTFGCLSGGPTPSLHKGKLTISELRAVVGSEGERWFEQEGPTAVVVVNFTLVIRPALMQVPTARLATVPLDELEEFFADHHASDEQALRWIADRPRTPNKL
jgi:hypothetical protein